MNIYSTWDSDLPRFEEMFKGYGTVKLLPKNYKSLKEVDLVIFPGGEDIHPSRYGSTRTDGEDYNEKRDEWEFKVFNDILKGAFNVKKILGICRGLQLLNVGLGGTLIFDIQEYYGSSHRYVHSLVWTSNGIFSSYLSKVNSLHHQCIELVGENASYKILAKESQDTGSIEVVCWTDFIFGVQFHPEYLLHKDVVNIRDKFAEHVIRWTKGEIDMMKMREVPKIITAPKEEKKKYFVTENVEAVQNFWTTADISWANTIVHNEEEEE